jgi:sec-independent protein translocase protein TatB
MFGMGFSEILVIGLVAILFLGPDKLPEAMVQIAKFFNSVRRTVNEAKSTFEEELHLKELKEEALSYRQSLSEAGSDISGFKNAVSNHTDELEEALRVARSGMPSDRLNGSVDDLLEEDEPAGETSQRPGVTEYKEMARKALEEAENSAEAQTAESPSVEDKASESAPKEPSRPAGFKHLDNEADA